MSSTNPTFHLGGVGDLVDRFSAVAPSHATVQRVHNRLDHVSGAVTDRLGIPGRDVGLLAAAFAVVGTLFGFSMMLTADPEPGPMRQLEAQHQEWLAEQAAADEAVQAESVTAVEVVWPAR